MKHQTYIFFLFIFCLCSCKKFVDVGAPKNQIASAQVYTDDRTATSAITGIYSQMISSGGFVSGSQLSIGFLMGLSADELKDYSNGPDLAPFYTNAVIPTNAPLKNNLWQEGYKYIYDANSALDGLNQSASVTDATRSQLMGEAKFIRAFCHFYLVNLFGDVPLVLTTDYQANNIAPRTSKATVYDQIITDLQDAKKLLAHDYAFAGGERTRPNKYAAQALLARAYLYRQDWVNSEKEADSVIANGDQYTLLDDLNTVFLANSQEAIWQLQPVLPSLNTNEGQIFILSTAPTSAALSDNLLNAFEPGDNRRKNWIDSITISSTTYFYAYKYKVQSGIPVTEYSMVVRLGEQYLIRAEARAQRNNLDGAKADINMIRHRAGLPDVAGNDLPTMLQQIQHERQVELFTELGHRWFDLARTASLDSVMTVVSATKGSSWSAYRNIFPVPQTEIQNDINLHQNPGY